MVEMLQSRISRTIAPGILMIFICVHGLELAQNSTNSHVDRNTSFRNLPNNRQANQSSKDFLRPSMNNNKSDIIKWSAASNSITDEEFIMPENAEQHLCMEQGNVLSASNEVKILSFGNTGGNAAGKKSERSWTIIPKHRMGSVSIMKRDNIVSEDIFRGGCSNLHIFQSYFNGTYRKWCKDRRLLPCNPISQIKYNIYGYSPVSQPGKAISLVYSSLDDTYRFDNNDPSSLYYFECGGILTRGLVQSPTFPADFSHTDAALHCSWDLLLQKDSYYGVLKFPRFHLPDCKNQRLTILQDTLLHESDVSDELLDIIRSDMNLTTRRYNESIENDAAYGHSSGKFMSMYREEGVTASQLARNPKAGIHLVERETFCGRRKPSKFMWRKGSTTISMTFQSNNSTLRTEGFRAIFLAFPRKKIARPKYHANLSEHSTSAQPSTHAISNYIALIILLPIAFTICLSFLICLLNRSTILTANIPQRDSSFSKSGAAHRRAQIVTASATSSKLTSLRTRSTDSIAHTPKTSDRGNKSNKRKGSIINVKYFIGRRKLSLKLKTVYEENSSNLSKSASLLVEEQKGTEPTVT